MASYYWIKLYDEILDDPKMGRLSDGAYRLAINLFLLAGRHPERSGRLPSANDIMWTLRLDETKFNAQWDELDRVGIVHMVDNNPMVTSFGKRQAPLSPAEKQKLYRDRKRGEALRDSNPPVTDGVTKSNADIDIYKDIYKDIDRDKNIYIHPDPEPITEIKTAVSQIIQEPLIGNEDRYDKAAYALMGWDATGDRIRGFKAWWDKNGNYSGRPAMKSLLYAYRDYIEGVVKTNGVAKPMSSYDEVFATEGELI
ncbi:MAG: hypothetical protein GY938_16770 [Ketobacter sp.]|nr:hypothetical protein [Ketobacter sp.]